MVRHPSDINQVIVDKVVARRGRLHAYTQLDPVQTALVVVDLDIGTVRRIYEEAGVVEVLGHINVTGSVST